MNKSEEIKDLAAALAKAQSQIVGAKADSKNPFFKSSYADIASVWDAMRDAFTKNGLSITQLADTTDGSTFVETVLMHSSGQWISGRLLIKPTKDDAQGQGGGLTYARRYALAAIAGVPQIDDDGETAMGRGEGEVKGEAPDVKEVAKVPAQTKPKIEAVKCEHTWAVSKFNQNEEYCTKGCLTDGKKTKRPKAS